MRPLVVCDIPRVWRCAETPRASWSGGPDGAGFSHLHPTGCVGAGQRSGRGLSIRGCSGLDRELHDAHSEQVLVFGADWEREVELLVEGSNERIQADACHCDRVGDVEAHVNAAGLAIEVGVERPGQIVGHVVQHLGVRA